jgi:prephenate dehydratase
MAKDSAPQQRIAFQGELGAFSHMAVHQMLGPAAVAIPFPTFEQAFQALAAGKVTGAMIPIENTLHGSVHENYDHLMNFGLPIEAETSVRIVHNLITLPGVAFNQIARVYSHPVALNQCLDFFRHHPRLTKMQFYDTAGSVKMLAEDKPEASAAIASALAAETYGLRILKKSIEDDRQNFTRFFLLRKKAVKPTESPRGWKTSLVFTTKNTPGSLFKAMAAFALRDLSLTKIESRPFRGRRWEYIFYLDFLGHADDVASQRALGHLAEVADMVKVLGCYPRGD